MGRAHPAGLRQCLASLLAPGVSDNRTGHFNGVHLTCRQLSQQHGITWLMPQNVSVGPEGSHLSEPFVVSCRSIPVAASSTDGRDGLLRGLCVLLLGTAGRRRSGSDGPLQHGLHRPTRDPRLQCSRYLLAGRYGCLVLSSSCATTTRLHTKGYQTPTGFSSRIVRK